MQPSHPVSTSDYYTAAPTLQRGLSDGRYIMAHHNINHWEIIHEKLKPVAEGEVTLDEIVGIISFFANDEQFQTRHKRKQKSHRGFMLDEFFKSLTQQERINYQRDLLPNIAKLILETEALFPVDRRIYILTQEHNESITLSKRQCACLIAHMAFCIVVDQPEGFKLAELIDFSVIYERPGLAKSIQRKIQKLRCIFTYFEKVLTENPQGNVVFERLFIEDTHYEEHLTKREEPWLQCDELMTKAQVLSEGRIEDMRDALQVVFSDYQLGDQVLQLPATQQQIMSLIHPELMLSLLFCEELRKDEAIKVSEAGRYSNYKGYGDTFEFVEHYAEENEAIERQHVIMDAGKYNSKEATSQFDQTCVLRELNKAYSGFCHQDEEARRVATGKWGCGVFKGNPQLKFIIQWLAASRAQRDIVFYTYEDAANFNVENTQKILNYYTGKEVGELYKDLVNASMEMQSEKMRAGTTQEESMLPPSKSDENKNLFKVLITQKGL